MSSSELDSTNWWYSMASARGGSSHTINHHTPQQHMQHQKLLECVVVGVLNHRLMHVDHDCTRVVQHHHALSLTR